MHKLRLTSAMHLRNYKLTTPRFESKSELVLDPKSDRPDRSFFMLCTKGDG